MRLSNLALVAAAVAGCATFGSNAPQNSPPPSQDMDPVRALGLWRSNFGAVKIESDDGHGGVASGAVHGVWQYDRQGQEVVGYFFGTLRGNVLSFRWQEPATPPLVGDGYIAFDPGGSQFSGRWWSEHRDRSGVWSGARQPPQPYPPNAPAQPSQDPRGTQPYPSQQYPSPAPQGAYPPPQGSYPAPQGSYPAPQSPYPSAQSPYPSPQGPQQPPPPQSPQPQPPYPSPQSPYPPQGSQQQPPPQSPQPQQPPAYN